MLFSTRTAKPRNSGEHCAALAEHPQEHPSGAEGHTDANSGWPHMVYFKACCLSFCTSVRIAFESHIKPRGSHKDAQQNFGRCPSGSISNRSSSYHLTVAGTKIITKALIRQVLKLAGTSQDDAVSYSQSVFTCSVILTSIQGKNSQS